ncbi:hypothetical protein V6N11_022242 [Hibiscus sabdariffa]|uniref:RNase H type-1 domain-containing protein n=1 Tax=Hibiscus sabdariffa TaxID=183260 RepID=A0ABR2TIL7_9ROSI
MEISLPPMTMQRNRDTSRLFPLLFGYPPTGVVAISVDGAFIQSHGVGIGVVARDSNGRVLGGLAQHSAVPASSAFAEAVAVHAGLQLACERGWPRLSSRLFRLILSIVCIVILSRTCQSFGPFWIRIGTFYLLIPTFKYSLFPTLLILLHTLWPLGL